MEKDLLKNEIRRMLQFHKSVLLVVMKTCFCVFRYGLWLLPWIFFAVLLWRPAFSVWKTFTRDPVPSFSQSPSVSAPCYCVEEKTQGWEAVPGKIETGFRTFERVSRQIRKK
ncbi:MAG: hypothetical protein BWY42_01632 [Candidatus Omnitrophica bacterium ADurb.Bin277]|nr:MAG: hypothetical protein BWY42_01632 [Candidatus Omnitrophica bacterium ADurb.Bin277]